MTERILTIIGTKNIKQKDSKFPIINKNLLLKRIEELTDEGIGYTLLISTKENETTE